MIDGLLNQFPAIKEILAGEVSKEKKKKGNSINDASLRFVFSKAYNLVPGMVRMVVTEKSFVDFCMKHKGIFSSTSSTPTSVKKKVAVKKATIKKRPGKTITAKKAIVKKAAPKKVAKKK